MPTGYSKLGIWNAALDIAGEYPLVSLTDNSAYARFLERQYAPTVRSLLRRHIWNFAIELHSLNADVIAPAARWDYQFSLPNGWLRVLPLTEDGERGGALIPHEVKNNKLLTDEYPPVAVELIMDRQDPSVWDPLFADFTAAALGVKIARRFSKSASAVKDAEEVMRLALQEAEIANAFEGSPEPVDEHDILRVRG